MNNHNVKVCKIQSNLINSFLTNWNFVVFSGFLGEVHLEVLDGQRVDGMRYVFGKQVGDPSLPHCFEAFVFL